MNINGILNLALNLSGLYRFYAKRLEKEIVEGDVPNHIAIVLDGNRRWAKRNLIMPKHGHFNGANAVENLLDWCEEFDIKIIRYMFYQLKTWKEKMRNLTIYTS